jgi:hypothetical protein
MGLWLVVVVVVVAAWGTGARAGGGACSLSGQLWGYDATEPSGHVVSERLDFAATGGGYRRTARVSKLPNCADVYYIADGTYELRTLGGGPSVLLKQMSCVEPEGSSACLPCPSNGEAEYNYAFSDGCTELYINAQTLERTYYSLGSKTLSGGAVFGIVFAVLLVTFGAAAAGFYYVRVYKPRRGYWAISEPAEPVAKF